VIQHFATLEPRLLQDSSGSAGLPSRIVLNATFNLLYGRIASSLSIPKLDALPRFEIHAVPSRGLLFITEIHNFSCFVLHFRTVRSYTDTHIGGVRKDMCRQKTDTVY
jgi:hypothetical protein